MASEFILTAVDAGVFTITLNRPEKLNSLTPEMHLSLGEAFDQFAADDSALVCVVQAAGERAFCAGSDLAGFRADQPGTYPPSGYAGLSQRHDLAKPVIAAVNGACLGGGFELAMACDIIVASDRAVFGLPEPKVGLIAIGGGVHRLVRQAGLKRAMLPLLTGRNISAQDGLAMGFVSELAAPDGLSAAVSRICAEIIACAPLAVQLSKEMAMWGLDQPTLSDALALQADRPSYRHWAQSHDAYEGPKAFTEKRKPEWTGR
jgi:enoyl-CoA hydratase/carnithine racemase